MASSSKCILFILFIWGLGKYAWAKLRIVEIGDLSEEVQEVRIGQGERASEVSEVRHGEARAKQQAQWHALSEKS